MTLLGGSATVEVLSELGEDILQDSSKYRKS